MNTSFWLLITTHTTCEGILGIYKQFYRLLKNLLEVELHFDWLTLNFLKIPCPLKVGSDWLISENIKVSLILMLDSDWLIAKFWKTPLLDWMSFISARLNSKSILIFFHVKNNWLKNLLFLFLFIHFLRLFNFSFLKN